MGVLRIEPTQEMPEIFLDSYNSTLNFSGVSRPENVFDLYNTIMDWIEESSCDFKKEIICNFSFRYINTSSKKMIFEILRELHKISFDANIPLNVNWTYRKIDEDILELGEEFEELIDHKFNYIVN
ncbi:MAG: SiaC family regulatory phosphoprotein [Bacteroidota bacterium]